MNQIAMSLALKWATTRHQDADSACHAPRKSHVERGIASKKAAPRTGAKDRYGVGGRRRRARACPLSGKAGARLRAFHAERFRSVAANAASRRRAAGRRQ